MKIRNHFLGISILQRKCKFFSNKIFSFEKLRSNKGVYQLIFGHVHVNCCKKKWIKQIFDLSCKICMSDRFFLFLKRFNLSSLQNENDPNWWCQKMQIERKRNCKMVTKLSCNSLNFNFYLRILTFNNENGFSFKY